MRLHILISFKFLQVEFSVTCSRNPPNKIYVMPTSKNNNEIASNHLRCSVWLFLLVLLNLQLAIPYWSRKYFFRLFLDSVKRFHVGTCRTLVLCISFNGLKKWRYKSILMSCLVLTPHEINNQHPRRNYFFFLVPKDWVYTWICKF